jgi:hypothetical protein
MGQRTSEPSVSESIDEFFEPMLGDAIDDTFDDEAPITKTKSRLAALRRRAEEQLEQKRMQQELDYIDLDWEE